MCRAVKTSTAKGATATSSKTQRTRAISRIDEMPHKNSDTERFGGPGSSSQDRKHPEKGGRDHEAPTPGSPTSGKKSKGPGGGGESDRTHTRYEKHRSGVD